MAKKLTDCTFSILGDSYSTFKGWIPEGQDVYYPNPASVSDVLSVEDTWWHQLMCRRNMRLLINDSWSGATVCTDVRPTQPKEAAFVKRMYHTMSDAGFGGEKPDVIFLFGCTNDSWIDREVGDVKFENRTEEDLSKVLAAYCEMVSYVVSSNPQAVVIGLINDILKPEIIEGAKSACIHYGAVPLALSDFDKENGHPNKSGMTRIADQIDALLSEL